MCPNSILPSLTPRPPLTHGVTGGGGGGGGGSPGSEARSCWYALTAWALRSESDSCSTLLRDETLQLEVVGAESADSVEQADLAGVDEGEVGGYLPAVKCVWGCVSVYVWSVWGCECVCVECVRV